MSSLESTDPWILYEQTRCQSSELIYRSGGREDDEQMDRSLILYRQRGQLGIDLRLGVLESIDSTTDEVGFRSVGDD